MRLPRARSRRGRRNTPPSSSVGPYRGQPLDASAAVQLAETALRAADGPPLVPHGQLVQGLLDADQAALQRRDERGLLIDVCLRCGQGRLCAEELRAVLAQRGGVTADLGLEDAEVAAQLLPIAPRRSASVAAVTSSDAWVRSYEARACTWSASRSPNAATKSAPAARPSTHLPRRDHRGGRGGAVGERAATPARPGSSCRPPRCLRPPTAAPRHAAFWHHGGPPPAHPAVSRDSCWRAPLPFRPAIPGAR